MDIPDLRQSTHIVNKQMRETMAPHLQEALEDAFFIPPETKRFSAKYRKKERSWCFALTCAELSVSIELKREHLPEMTARQVVDELVLKWKRDFRSDRSGTPEALEPIDLHGKSPRTRVEMQEYILSHENHTAILDAVIMVIKRDLSKLGIPGDEIRFSMRREPRERKTFVGFTAEVLPEGGVTILLSALEALSDYECEGKTFSGISTIFMNHLGTAAGRIVAKVAKVREAEVE